MFLKSGIQLSISFLTLQFPICAVQWISARKCPEKGKAIPVRGCGGPYGCETLRLQHFLDNRPTYGGYNIQY
jgi:hypothetical protein